MGEWGRQNKVIIEAIQKKKPLAGLQGSIFTFNLTSISKIPWLKTACNTVQFTKRSETSSRTAEVGKPHSYCNCGSSNEVEFKEHHGKTMQEILVLLFHSAGSLTRLISF